MSNSTIPVIDAAGYTRYSTNQQTENSTAYQKEKIEAYCKQHNMRVVAWFHDEGKSGTNTDERPAFLRMEAAADLKLFKAIVVYDITRGSRDVEDWFGFRKKMHRLNIDVVSVEDKLGDINNPNDFLTELLTVGIGQHQVLSTRLKSRDGVAVKAQQGIFLGGTPPLGYDVVGGHYLINPQEADVVRRIFDMYGHGCSYNQILDALDGARGKMGRPLGKNSIPTILHNERYIGTYTWNKRYMKIMRKWAGGGLNPNCVRIENHIPPIVTTELWERVNERLKNNKRATNKAKREYLLTGLIECSICGATYVGHTSVNKKGYSTPYYVCGNKYRTRTCSAHNLNANEVDAFVVQQLHAYLDTTDFEEAAASICTAVNGASVDLTAERKELLDIDKKVSNGVRAVLSGMDIPELQDEIDRLRVRKSELEDIIARRSSEHTTIDHDKLVALFKRSAEMIDTNPAEVIKCHVTRIYAHTDGSVTVNVGVHINGCGGQI